MEIALLYTIYVGCVLQVSSIIYNRDFMYRGVCVTAGRGYTNAYINAQPHTLVL